MSLTIEGFDIFQPITASDTVDILAPKGAVSLPVCVTDAIYVGTSNATSTVAAVMADGLNCSFVGLLAGKIYPLRVRRINSTGTAGASNLVALYIR